MISAGQPHKAVPLTGALCTAVAARLDGSVVQRLGRPTTDGAPLRIAHPSGVMTVDALVSDGIAIEAVVFRTARRLMEGRVLVPARLLETAS
jgi:2-methylaconitate cis-trans-isomerase PrpF